MTALIAAALGLVTSVLVVVVWRALLVRREWPRKHHEPFDGVIHRVGEAVVAERRAEQPKATVIAMHGFVEDMRYFVRHYQDPSIQLIALMSCGYHVPVTDAAPEEPSWAKKPSERHGTIAYDAEVLVQALEHLPKADTIRVHGHSRGGAVVLEAARKRPDLFEDVEVMLEAPVLPRAKFFVQLGALVLWLYPFVIPAWRREPLGARFTRPYGKLDDARKRELMEGLPHNPKRTATLMANIHDMMAWMAERDHSIYAHVRRGTVLVPSHDRVLDAVSMHESAKRAASLNVVRVEGCTHFVTLDRPEAIPALTAT